MFRSIGGSQLKAGGAAYFSDSNITITNSQFNLNSAIEGGAIYSYWSGVHIWIVSITNSSFIGNAATLQGGAIKYNYYRPNISNAYFENNTALYGTNIASYPIQIGIKGNESQKIIFNNIASGSSDNITIECALYDHDGQINTLDNSSSLELKSIIPNTKIAGDIVVKVTKGIGVFSNVIFYAIPGRK